MATKSYPLSRLVKACGTCGWTRTSGCSPEWMNRKIPHAVYGLVSQRRLVQLDIANHDCDAFITTVSRLQNAEKKRYVFDDAA